MSRPPILFTAAADRGRALAERWRAARPSFCCVLAHTDTCLLPGVSAAGISEAVRPLTPAADAEVVLLGAPRCLPRLPSNPAGAPGPSGITRAALQLAGLPAAFVGAGLTVWPATDCLRVPSAPGGNIAAGHAVPAAPALFAAGQAIGRRYASGGRRLVLAESVPGGTTTALALLLALGIDATGRVSGSVPGNAHALKQVVATTALHAAGLTPGAGRADPLAAVAAVGDPMQPLAAGIATGFASQGGEILLAGGSQMIAVAALIAALRGPAMLEPMALGTTRWIVQDPAADITGLATEVSPRLAVLAANLDFSHSAHRGLRAYEQFLVKEGVGAGGASVAALLASGLPVEYLEIQIDATYDVLLGRLQAEPCFDR